MTRCPASPDARLRLRVEWDHRCGALLVNHDHHQHRIRRHRGDQGLNELELTFGAILMLLAGIKSPDLSLSFSTVGKESTEFRQTLKALNEFMSRARLPADLCLRVREYFHRTQHAMSPALQAESPGPSTSDGLRGSGSLQMRHRHSSCSSLLVWRPKSLRHETVPLGKLYRHCSLRRCSATRYDAIAERTDRHTPPGDRLAVRRGLSLRAVMGARSHRWLEFSELSFSLIGADYSC